MRVGVVGGGVVGLATAWYLKKFGAEPVVVEAGGVGGGCSRGNNGWVCPSVSTPLPAPGLTAKSLLWMLRRASHFHIPGAALPRLAPWLLRFRAHCTESARAHGIRALASLNAVTVELYDELAADGVEFERGRSGILFAYRDPALRDGKVKDIETVAAKSGASWTELDGDEVCGMEPLLRPGFACGIHVETDQHVRPESLTEGLAAALRAGGTEIFEGTMALGFEWDGAGTRWIGRTSGWASAGGTRVRTPGWVPGPVRAGSRVRAIVTSRGDLEVDAVVLAAGVQTGPLARMAGWRIPLTAGKGYSVTIERPARQLRQPLYLGDARVGMTPFEGALRFGGTMELSGVNRRMDTARVRALRRAVSREVDIPEAREGGRAWVGMRPMVPDTLPVIGKVPSRENVYVNTGHQMLGVTLAPVSGWALAGLVVEGRAGVGLGAFGVGRFRGGVTLAGWAR